jgi:Domain of unknown function (DU1801)
MSEPSAIDTYLAGVEPDRRETLRAVHGLVTAAMPDGYQETIANGMVTWSIPLERYPTTYNGQPLAYLALAAQKRHYSLYLMGLYSDTELAATFRQRWEASGRKLDMGKSCLRFKSLVDLDLGLVAEAVAGLGVDDFIALYERVRADL